MVGRYLVFVVTGFFVLRVGIIPFGLLGFTFPGSSRGDVVSEFLFVRVFFHVVDLFKDYHLAKDFQVFCRFLIDEIIWVPITQPEKQHYNVV